MLAFDDGPCDTTHLILNALKSAGVRATFFVVGKQIGDWPDEIGRMVAEGHTIGNHSWSHVALVDKPRREVALEIVRTDAEVFGITGVKPRDFRPPYVRWNDGLVVPTAEAFGHRVHVEPSFGDYKMDADTIISLALHLHRAGRDLWLHENVEATLEALPDILTRL